MSGFSSILLTLDGSVQAAKGIGCALWLSQALGATLHVLHATAHPQPAPEALTQLGIAPAHGARVVLHQLPGLAEAAVLQQIDALDIGLVIMSARGETAAARRDLSRRLGSVAQAVIERSPVPVLLLPANYREVLPWTSMLAAATGEAAASQALMAAVQLAAALQLKVRVVYCEDGPPLRGGGPFGAYADAAYHEYPQRLEQLIEGGLAGCGCEAEQLHCVEEVLLRRGEAATVLLDHIARHGSSVLAIGWHGSLGTGRALVFKRLLDAAQCPLLLVRASEQLGARLKVGSEIDEGWGPEANQRHRATG